MFVGTFYKEGQRNEYLLIGPTNNCHFEMSYRYFVMYLTEFFFGPHSSSWPHLFPLCTQTQGWYSRARYLRNKDWRLYLRFIQWNNKDSFKGTFVPWEIRPHYGVDGCPVPPSWSLEPGLVDLTMENRAFISVPLTRLGYSRCRREESTRKKFVWRYYVIIFLISLL